MIVKKQLTFVSRNTFCLFQVTLDTLDLKGIKEFSKETNKKNQFPQVIWGREIKISRNFSLGEGGKADNFRFLGGRRGLDAVNFGIPKFCWGWRWWAFSHLASTVELIYGELHNPQKLNLINLRDFLSNFVCCESRVNPILILLHVKK